MNHNLKQKIIFFIFVIGAIAIVIYDALFFPGENAPSNGHYNLKPLVFPFLVFGLLLLKKKAMKEKEKYHQLKKEEDEGESKN